VLSPDELTAAPAVIRDLLADPEQFRRDVQRLREEWVFNLGTSSQAAADAVAQIADSVTNSAANGSADGARAA
jgi:hypothetical protein